MLSEKEITLANLTKVYEELPKLAEKIPAIIEDFDMQVYGVYDCSLRENLATECNSCGCGLGNSARLFTIVEEDFNVHNSLLFDYNLFGQRILPALYGTKWAIKTPNDLWDFLFDWEWANYQPTFHQFIERVKYAIDMDLEIGSWKLQEKSFIKE